MPRLVKAARSSSSMSGVPIVTRLRNEMRLLPDFFKHYRQIGITNFHIIDNKSTDGTFEFLADQEDVTLYEEHGDYAASRAGADWVDQVLHEVALGKWAIHVDCDEHLVYPGMETIGIDDFVQRLESGGNDSCRAILIDMYHPGCLREPPIVDGERSIHETFNYFDRDYYMRREPQKPWKKNRRGPFQIIGGPRCRLVSNLEREKARSWRDFALAGQIDRFIEYVPRHLLRVFFRVWPYYWPALHKRPLNRITASTTYLNSHDTTNKRIAPTLVGLLHFKFRTELNRCFATDEIVTSYYRRGLEREQLRLGLMAWPHETLLYEGSTLLRSSRDLEDLGLIGDQFAELVC